MSFIFIYVTTRNKREAKKIATHLLTKKLVACANIFPIESNYWWKGKIENSKEYALILKTRKKNFKKVKDTIKKIHFYSIPCIAKIEAEFNESFQKWIKENTI